MQVLAAGVLAPRGCLIPAVQQVQGGGWTREALVVLRLFHGQLHRGASTATPAHLCKDAVGHVGLALRLQVRVKLRRLRYCIPTAPNCTRTHPRRPRPGLAGPASSRCAGAAQ